MDNNFSLLTDLIQMSVNIVLVIVASLATIFAGLTWRQSKKFWVSEQQLKKAFIVPTDNPGFFKPTDDETLKSCLYVSFKNYGINPASKIKMNFYLFSDFHDDAFENNLIYSNSSFVYNIIPHSANINLLTDSNTFNNTGLSKNKRDRIKYLVCEIFYTDAIIKSNLKNIYFWRLQQGGELFEVDKNIYNELNIRMTNIKS